MSSFAVGDALATDPQRDRAVEVLKTAFVDGAIGLDELSSRVHSVLGATTVAEIESLIGDVTVVVSPVSLTRELARSESRLSDSTKWWGRRPLVVGALLAIVVSGGTAVAVQHQVDKVPEHCLVRNGSGPYYRVC